MYFSVPQFPHLLNKNNSFPYILRSNVTNVYQVPFNECLTYINSVPVASIIIIIIIGGYVKKKRKKEGIDQSQWCQWQSQITSGLFLRVAGPHSNGLPDRLTGILRVNSCLTPQLRHFHRHVDPDFKGHVTFLYLCRWVVLCSGHHHPSLSWKACLGRVNPVHCVTSSFCNSFPLLTQNQI